MSNTIEHFKAESDPVEAVIRLTLDRLSRLGLLSPAQSLEAANDVLDDLAAVGEFKLTLAQQREVLRRVISQDQQGGTGAGPGRSPDHLTLIPGSTARDRAESLKDRISKTLLQRIDVGLASTLSKEELRDQISATVRETLQEFKLRIGAQEQRDLIAAVVADMVGLGPLEPLLADETITDILVNGAQQIFVERAGRLVLTEAVFRDNAHVLQVARRIVSNVGRRIDELNPLVDARLDDGSRVNVIVPPLALDGPAIAIRKFSRRAISLDGMVQTGSLSREMAEFLKIAARCRANIVVSGGTGSGKTTLLNAMSQMIDESERIITIEDAAELRLQQIHIVRLETRPPSLEGAGEITIRQLLKNALRMRPDRIILGEVRGEEAMDMLQAMNTGHDGSLCTLHANSPEEAAVRLEHMVALSGVNIPPAAVRQQIAAAIQIIVQVARMRDGKRRLSHISEVRGLSDGQVEVVPIFEFQITALDEDNRIQGHFARVNTPVTLLPRAAPFGLDAALRGIFA